MATAGDVVYESDPEEATLSLATRRREASDEEEEGTEDERENRENNLSKSNNFKARIAPDSESDCQGAAADYDDDEDSEIDEDIEEEEDERVEVVRVKYVEVGDEEFGEGGRNVGAAEVAEGESAMPMCKELKDNTGTFNLLKNLKTSMNCFHWKRRRKKTNLFLFPLLELFICTMTGSATMKVIGTEKYIFGLYVCKDNWKWGHDKFEEMTLQDRRKTSGHYYAHGRNQGSDPHYPRENKYKASNNIGENRGLKNVRCRGPRRYQPSANNKIKVHLIQEKQFVKSTKKDFQNLGRFPSATPNEEFDPTSIRKQVFASSLIFASPPFYPSCSSNKDIPMTEKRDVKAVSIDHNLRSSAPRQKNLAASVAMEKLYVNDSISQVSGKSSTWKIISSQTPMVHGSSQPRAQGRAIAPGILLRQQVHKSPFLKISTSIDLPVFEEAEILSELSNPKSGLDEKRRGVYNGAQVIGSFENIGGHSDKHISATPTFLPAFWHGSSNRRYGFSGYVGQPQLGMGNSKMTWLPVLEGAAVGALGTTYCSPYIGTDGTYHTHQTTQASPSVTLSETIANKSIDEWKPSQKNEIVDEEFGQRQNSTRRYTTMNFGMK